MAGRAGFLEQLLAGGDVGCGLLRQQKGGEKKR
jgi:hypothetical protein